MACMPSATIWKMALQSSTLGKEPSGETHTYNMLNKASHKS